MSEPGPWELAPITFTAGQLKQLLLGYWFSAPPSSMATADADLDMKLATLLAQHRAMDE